MRKVLGVYHKSLFYNPKRRKTQSPQTVYTRDPLVHKLSVLFNFNVLQATQSYLEIHNPNNPAIVPRDLKQHIARDPLLFSILMCSKPHNLISRFMCFENSNNRLIVSDSETKRFGDTRN